MTFAFSIDIHLCQDKVKSVSYFGQKSSCQGDLSIGQPSKCTKEDNFHSKSCCSNQQFSQDTSLEDNSPLQFSLKKQATDIIQLNPFSPTTSNVHLTEETRGEIPFPPKLIWNQQRIAFQVFVI